MKSSYKYTEFINRLVVEFKNNPTIKNYIVYGLNNCGKTYLEKELFKSICDSNFNDTLNQNPNKFFLFPFYFDVERTGKEEAEHINSGYKISIDINFVDSIKRKIDNGNKPFDYIIAREWICSSNNKQLLADALKSIFSDENYDISNFAVYSDGIKNVINILSTLFYIKSLVNANLIKTKAIILIDEIELYLHIKSQVAFVNFLLEKFPEFAFVFTSHSPVLMQRINACSIYVLDENHTHLDLQESQYFFSCDQIMENTFGLNRYPDQFVDFINYLKLCLSRPNCFKLEQYKTYLDSCRIKDYNYHLLLNNLVLDFVKQVKDMADNKIIKKGSELYNAVCS